MMMLGAAQGLVLTLIAGLHAYWGIGGIWPGTDPRSCARAVGGFAGAEVMPSAAACFAVAAMLATTALAALAAGGLFATPFEPGAIAGATLFLAAVFLFRGALGYVPAWWRFTPEQPFRRLDMRYYSPLCLALGAGFLLLGLKGLHA